MDNVRSLFIQSAEASFDPNIKTFTESVQESVQASIETFNYLGFTQCKAEQPLEGMELQKTKNNNNKKANIDLTDTF